MRRMGGTSHGDIWGKESQAKPTASTKPLRAGEKAKMMRAEGGRAEEESQSSSRGPDHVGSGNPGEDSESE